MTIEEFDKEEESVGNTNKHRIGRFRIPDKLIRHRPDEALRILDECLVVEAVMKFASSSIEYTAIGEMFDELPQGCEPAGYGLNFKQVVVGKNSMGQPIYADRFTHFQRET